MTKCNWLVVIWKYSYLKIYFCSVPYKTTWFLYFVLYLYSFRSHFLIQTEIRPNFASFLPPFLHFNSNPWQTNQIIDISYIENQFLFINIRCNWFNIVGLKNYRLKTTINLLISEKYKISIKLTKKRVLQVNSS